MEILTYFAITRIKIAIVASHFAMPILTILSWKTGISVNPTFNVYEIKKAIQKEAVKLNEETDI